MRGDRSGPHDQRADETWGAVQFRSGPRLRRSGQGGLEGGVHPSICAHAYINTAYENSATPPPPTHTIRAPPKGHPKTILVICARGNAVSGPLLGGKRAFSPLPKYWHVYNIQQCVQLADSVYLGQTVSTNHKLQFLSSAGKQEWCTGQRSGIPFKMCTFLHIGGLRPHMGHRAHPGGL